MRVRDIMSRPVVTVHPWTPIRRAASALTERAITALPVVDTNGQLVGMVSEGDLLWHRVPADPDAHLARPSEAGVDDPPGVVADVMASTVVTVPPSASVADAAQLMLEYDVRSIPVVAGTTVEGIVSRRDVLRALVHRDNQIAVDVRRGLEECCGHSGRWDLDVADGLVTITGRFAGEDERVSVRKIASRASDGRAVELRSPVSDRRP